MPDEFSQPFFEGTKQGELLILRCTACGTHRLPEWPRCDECLASDYEWVHSSGRGVVHTFAIMHHVYHPGFEARVPYNLAVVELEEGPRLLTNLVGVANAEIAVGQPVEVTFERLSAEFTIPKFQPRR